MQRAEMASAKKLSHIDFERLREPIEGLEVRSVLPTFDPLIMAVGVTERDHGFLGMTFGLPDPFDVGGDTFRESFETFILHTRMLTATYESQHGVNYSRTCLYLGQGGLKHLQSYPQFRFGPAIALHIVV
jgi:hypothetical protein